LNRILFIKYLKNSHILTSAVIWTSNIKICKPENNIYLSSTFYYILAHEEIIFSQFQFRKITYKLLRRWSKTLIEKVPSCPRDRKARSRLGNPGGRQERYCRGRNPWSWIFRPPWNTERRPETCRRPLYMPRQYLEYSEPRTVSRTFVQRRTLRRRYSSAVYVSFTPLTIFTHLINKRLCEHSFV